MASCEGALIHTSGTSRIAGRLWFFAQREGAIFYGIHIYSGIFTGGGWESRDADSVVIHILV